MTSRLARLMIVFAALIAGLGAISSGLARAECPMAECAIESPKPAPCCHPEEPETPKPCCCIKGDYDAPGILSVTAPPSFGFPVFGALPSPMAVVDPVTSPSHHVQVWRPDAGPPKPHPIAPRLGRAPPFA